MSWKHYYGMYDWEGRRISDDESNRLRREAREVGRDWARVDDTTVGDARISTVHILMDHRLWGDGPPLIFETLVFGGGLADDGDRYSTEAEARAGHATWVEKCRTEQAEFAAMAARPDVRAAVLAVLSAQEAYRAAVGKSAVERRTDDFDRLVQHVVSGVAA